MKRFALPVAVLLFLAGGGLFVLRRLAPHTGPVAAWLPAGTVLLEEMPNLHRTEERWPQTALAQIFNEPEVRAFLERPMGHLPGRAALDKRLAQLRSIDPGQVFLAVTEWSDAPKAVAGLYCCGSRADLDSLVDELREQAQEAWPGGKSDIEKYGSGEIETFTAPTFTAALAFRGRWLFIATDPALLKATLDRYEARPGPDSLAELPVFKSTLEHLPDFPDNIFFVRPGLLADKAASLAMMVNPTADLQGTDAVKKIDAVGAALKLDGEVMRDAVYVTKAEPAQESPLARDALKLSSTDTIVAVCNRLESPGAFQLPDAKADPTGALQMLESYLQVFQDQGLGAAQFTQAFGPETGVVVDWPSGAVIPTPLAMVDVRDQAKARKFMDTLATLPLSAGAIFTRKDDGGISFYSLPPTGIGFFPLQVTLGLTGKALIGALSMDAVTQAAKRLDAATPGLSGAPAYLKATALVVEPTSSFTYLDTKAIFERVYGLFRSVASMGFVPHLADYVDIGKLPAPETISRHLSPMVASGAVKDGGLLYESAGPVTTMEAATVAAIALGAAAIPVIEEELKGQSVSIPGFPGMSPGSLNPGSNAFTSPWNQGGSAPPSLPSPSPAPSVPAASASPSAGTP